MGGANAKLKRDDLYSLEKYAEIRPEFRAQVMAHKRDRRLPIGPHVTLHFEDRMIMQYQIQEMLRAERIYEAEGIQEELDTYNPLIPDGRNWKATMMVEFDDPAERKVQLSKLIGIERKTYVKIGDHERVYPIANEDLERETEEKTSSVHFLRFELSDAMAADLKNGAKLVAGVDHDNYRHEVDPVPDNVRQSLIGDLD
ncbi:MAG: DUF3501 family protein [Chromatiales bacterium]|nr:DUF3501 family protein [Chromatiales bacterium]